jgi:tellurium resistance protein TerD
MAINLEKGNKINLEKQSSTKLRKVRVGLGWDTSDTIGDCDLDVSVFGCAYNSAGDPKLIDEKFFVYFNNLVCPGGSIRHSGDSRTGAAEGDDETIYFDLENIPTEIDEIPIIVTIYQAVARGHDFGQIKNAYVKVYNDETNEELSVYHLTTDCSGFISLQFGSLFKDADADNNWAFQAIGVGYSIELGDFVKEYTS